MLQKIIYIIIFMFVASQVEATNLILRVVDKNNLEAVVGARVVVSVNGQTIGKMTDSNGSVTIEYVQFPLKINAYSIGYDSLTSTLRHKDYNKKNENVYATIKLSPSLKVFDDLIVTAQAKPVLATQSIYKVNTINNQQILARGAISLNDVLGYELNNFVSNDNLLGSSVSVAGIGGQNIKILVNGIPVLGRENGNIDLGQLNLNNIKRVEMIQGPMSVMYGSNALGGVINLITNTPQKRMNVGARMYLESIGKYNLSSNLNYAKGKHSIQASLARNFFQGWTPKNDSVERYQLWKPKTQYTGDLQYIFSLKNLSFTYFTSLMNEEIVNKGTPIINPYEGYAFDEYYKTNRIINSLGTNIHVNKTDQITLLNSYSYYGRTKNRFKKDLVSLNQIETQSIGDQDTTTFQNVNLRGTYQSNRIKNLDLLGGYEYSFDKGTSYKLAEDATSISDLGLFASATYRKGKFSVQPSARYTLNNKYGTACTPAFHSKYDFNEKTQIRASYAKGFRSPSLKEMYLQFVDQNHTIIGNPDLKPEIGQHAELGIETQQKYGKTQFSFGANAYFNSIENLITLAVYNGSGILRQYANLQKYENWMFTLKGKMISKQFKVELASSAMFVQNTGFIPKHSIYELSGNVTYTSKPLKTNFNFNYKFNSQQPVLTVDEKYLFTAPIHVANISAQKYIFSEALSLQMGVKNLFNLQTTNLRGATDLQGNGHISSTGMQLFPARSVFMDIQYRFNR